MYSDRSVVVDFAIDSMLVGLSRPTAMFTLAVWWGNQ